MRIALFLLVLLFTPSTFADAPLTIEVLVGTTPTLMPSVAGEKAIEIQNLGPNPIYCSRGQNGADGGSPVYSDGGLIDVAGAARVIEAKASGSPADVWPLEVPEYVPVWCVASTAAQVHLGGTVVTLITK